MLHVIDLNDLNKWWIIHQLPWVVGDGGSRPTPVAEARRGDEDVGKGRDLAPSVTPAKAGILASSMDAG